MNEKLFKKREYNWSKEEWQEIYELEQKIKDVLLKNNWKIDSVEYAAREKDKLIFNVFENFENIANWYVIITITKEEQIYVFPWDEDAKPKIYRLNSQ